MTTDRIGAMSTSPIQVQYETTHKSIGKPVEVSPLETEIAKSKAPTEETLDPEKIKKAVEELNKNMQHSVAVYGIHEKTNRVTIKMLDKETKEVIKEFPPEKTLDLIAKAWELAGLMVDEKR